jgi:hypothetical protein
MIASWVCCVCGETFVAPVAMFAPGSRAKCEEHRKGICPCDPEHSPGTCDKYCCPKGCINQPPKKETVLEEAARLVNGPRRAEYGHPKDNFNDIADMWTVILHKKLLSGGRFNRVDVDDVILMMIALKLCRGKQGYKRDTAVDIAGYAQCWELVNK